VFDCYLIYQHSVGAIQFLPSTLKSINISHTTIKYLPSFSLALQATIVQALSLIISRFNSSSISSAGKADIKSYLFAYINIGNPANLSSYRVEQVRIRGTGRILLKVFKVHLHIHPYVSYQNYQSHISKQVSITINTLTYNTIDFIIKVFPMLSNSLLTP
jgi:hypothetical protein